MKWVVLMAENESTEELTQPYSQESVFARIAARSTEQIAADLHKPIESRELRLLGMDREKINAIREGVNARREEHSAIVAQLESEQLAALKYIPDEHAEVRNQATEKLHDRIIHLNKVFLAEQLAHLDTADTAVALALEAFFDTNTPLFARKAFIRTMGHVIESETHKKLANPDYEPIQFYMSIKDGMLFHAGNTIRTMSGFDRGLRGEASAQIAVSRYFAKEYCPYQPFSSSEQAKQDKHLHAFVLEVPNNKALFDQLTELSSREGNYYEEFRVRVNAGGGDEFLDVFGVRGPDAAEMLKIGRELQKAITSSQTLSPEYDVVNPAQARELTEPEIERRAWLKEKYPNTVNAFNVSGYSAESKFINKFWNAYRLYLKDSQNHTINHLFSDPHSDIRFDMAEYESDFESGELPTLDDGITLFIEGKDRHGKRLVDGEGNPLYGYYTKEGKPDEQKIDNYSLTISERVRAQMSVEDLGNPDKVAGAISKMIDDDVLNNYVDYLNDQVNNVAKPRKKIAVLLNAYKYEPDPKDVFNVAATYATGREVFVALDDVQKSILAVSVMKEMSQAMNEHPADPALSYLRREVDQLKTAYLKEIGERPMIPTGDLITTHRFSEEVLDNFDFDSLVLNIMSPPERRQQTRISDTGHTNFSAPYGPWEER